MDIDLEIFSPVHQINDKLFDERGLKVFIKRDDLIHPIISGNKWRKLKHILKRAQLENKNHLVTFGGAYSNHLLATAAAAAKFGLHPQALYVVKKLRMIRCSSANCTECT
jgi:1-aminocyclopropane-1-carboxylate deaminase